MCYMLENLRTMFVNIKSIVIVYQMVSLLPQQCIKVLIPLHGVKSEIFRDAVCMYLYMYLVLLAQYFFSFFLSLFLFCTLLRIKIYMFSPSKCTKMQN